MQQVNPQYALQNVNYLVVGLGLSGYSVARFLLKNGYRCRLQDNREITPYLSRLQAEFGAIDFKAGLLDSALVEWADVLVVSPGVAIHRDEIQQAAQQGKSIIGDIELFAQVVNKPVIAITGSNGKSTVTQLVGDIINCAGKSAAVGGNIGTAALDLLDEQTDFYVLELSSYQLETTQSLRPVVAVLLNLSEDHLDRYAGYDDYVAAKRRIYQRASHRVSNADEVATQHDGNDLQFSLDPEADVEFKLLQQGGFFLAHHDEPWLNVEQLKLTGRHNWANCLAAMAITHLLGIDKDSIVRGLVKFNGIAHRSQWVAEVQGVEWINDSKATNVGAAMASIKGRNGPVILIAGGQSKGVNLSVMADLLQQKVKRVLLLGEDAEAMRAAWQGSTDIEIVADMQTAVRRAREEAKEGDCVLLAPACASFDMYQNFEARGNDFIRLVREVVTC